MATRFIKLSGTISTRQFWPAGRASPESFRVRLDLPPRGGRKRRPDGAVDTSPLVGARVTRALDRLVLHPAQGSVVRLRAVSAPVLHARPAPLRPRQTLTQKQRARFRQREHEFRQPLAETAAFAFRTMLRQDGAQRVACEILVPAARPPDAVDIAGRLLADVFVERDGERTNLSQWLLENGWAFPDLTDRLSKSECRAALGHAARARRKRLGVWATYTARIGRLDTGRRYRRGTKDSSLIHDAGPLGLPRLFRQRVSHMANRHAWLTRARLREFMAEQPTPCYVTASYLQRKRGLPPQRFLREFIRPDGYLNKGPGELVFVEPKAQLITADGRSLARW